MMQDNAMYLIDINETNLTEVLQQAQQQPVIFSFYAPSDALSNEFNKLLRQVVTRHNGQIILANINCEEQHMIVAQFQVQALPTTYFFKEGRPIDAFTDSLTMEQLEQRLAIMLPKEEEIKFNLALDLLAKQAYDQALPLLKEAWQLSDKKNSDIALLYAETYIEIKNTEQAQAILSQIPIQDRDSRWQGLQAQIDLLNQAADTPEIQQLQQEFAQTPSSDIAIKLAVQLHQAHRNEEALQLLFSFLKQDLNAQNGEVKQQFLSIIIAMGSHDPLTNKYRRLMYSLLY